MSFTDKPLKNIGGSPGAAVDKTTKANPFNWSILTVTELMQQRDEIDKHLPPTQLCDLNLEEQMLLQFHLIRQLQSDNVGDDELPLNQRAMVAKAVADIINKLTELQDRIYTTERYKAVENIFIATLKEFPEEVAAKHIARYETLLEGLSGQSSRSSR